MFCSLFEMENYQGDLTDVVRASSSGGGPYTYGGCATGVSSDFSLDSTSGDRLWSHLPGDDSMNFGDPFSATRDPLLHHHHLQYLSASTFNFASSNSPELIVGSDGFRGGGGGGSATVSERPCDIFSRMLQISPNSKLGDCVTPCDSSAVGNSPSSTSTKPSAPTAAAAMVPSSEGMINNGHGSNPVCLMDNSGMQISPPRNPAIKRRKSQVKKVVCIPAPAPANSRSSSGEVVPSDLWAWRKYGQKPIKGSPYPRGYYRCSSSKGCSARKQVERSRTDPNMLVITYTSEHNHPWPTQRNALAGSTRSHSSRNMTPPLLPPAVGSSSASKPTAASVRRASPRDERMGSSPLTAAVKEESEEDQTSERADQEFPYELTLPVANDCDDFFAEFAEMKAQDDEADPLNNLLLFTQSLVAGNDERSKGRRMASLDPFSELYDWAENNQFGNPNANSFKEAKGG